MSDESSTVREIQDEADETNRPPLSRGAALSVLVFEDEGDDDAIDS